MVKIENLTKEFDGFIALNGLNLHIKKGSIYGLVGVNGSGKTTAIKHLAGIYRQDSGQVYIDGATVYDNARIKERVGYVPDDLYFFPQYSMKAMSRFYKGMYQNWNSERFIALQKLFKLDEKRKLGKFSKGMQKQAALIFSLCMSPDVLILDEPIDGLDPIVRKQVFNQIIEDVANRELTVLISSHNLKEMDGICDAIGIIKDGHMLVERDLDDLKSNVHKIQVAFEPEEKPAVYEGLEILYAEQRGSIDLLVIRGEESEIAGRVKNLNPLLYDRLPLTLEEIFVYEVEYEQ